MADEPALADRDDVLLRSRAMADPTRLSILRLIQRSAEPVDVRSLADAVSLHPNAVRQHLAVLRDAGLVVAELHRHGVGRPSYRYRPDPSASSGDGAWHPYERLSLLLLQVAAGRPVRAVGEEEGRRLAAGLTTADPVEAVEQPLRQAGFAPTVESCGDGVEVTLHACPLATAAHASPLVCELHLGILDGLARSRGGAVEGLRIAPSDGGCRFRLTPPPHREERP